MLGFDSRDREVLSYLPGRIVDVDTEELTEGQLRAVATWTRQLHHAVSGFSHPGPWRFRPIEGATLIAHNDIAPYNICFDRDELVGVFDWDVAGPSTPLYELAFIAWNCVPLFRDIGASAAAERLELIAGTYRSAGDGRSAAESELSDSPTAADILSAVPARIQVMLDEIPVGAAHGDQGMVNLMADGEPGRSQRALEDLRQRTPTIAAELS